MQFKNQFYRIAHTPTSTPKQKGYPLNSMSKRVALYFLLIALVCLVATQSSYGARISLKKSKACVDECVSSRKESLSTCSNQCYPYEIQPKLKKLGHPKIDLSSDSESFLFDLRTSMETKSWPQSRCTIAQAPVYTDYVQITSERVNSGLTIPIYAVSWYNGVKMARISYNKWIMATNLAPCPPPLFKQCDARWGSQSIGGSTVCKIGCLMSSVSMALAQRGKMIGGQEANPGTLNTFLKSNGGYAGDLFVWGSVARFGLSYVGQISDISQIKSHVNNGDVVILNVLGGGHWVLARSVNANGSFNVNDPGYNRDFYAASEVRRAGIFVAV